MGEERHTWQPDKAALPPPSFERFSTMAAWCGTVGQEHWRIGKFAREPAPALLQAKSSAGRGMPTPLAYAHSYPTKDFLILQKEADPGIPILHEAKAKYASCSSEAMHEPG